MMQETDFSWGALPAGTRENYDWQRKNTNRMFMGGDHDEVPIVPLVGAYAATDHGRSIYEYYTEQEKAIAWQLDTARKYAITPYLNWNFSVYWSEDYGGTIRMPTGLMAAPAILTYPADTVEKADKIEPLSPEELLKGPTMERHVRGLKAVEAYSGKGYKPWQFIYEPFAIASFWVSPENLLMWVMQEPELVHSITEGGDPLRQCLRGGEHALPGNAVQNVLLHPASEQQHDVGRPVQGVRYRLHEGRIGEDSQDQRGNDRDILPSVRRPCRRLSSLRRHAVPHWLGDACRLLW